VFGDDITNVRTIPFANSNNPKIRACKLLSVNKKPNKRANRKKKFPTGSFAILDAMINFINVMKKLELEKMKLKKFITFQMLQSEKNGRQMMIQRQLYLVVLFAKD
jgi:hypothetical protein